MSLRPPRPPIRGWTALTGAGLSFALGILIVREARPSWRAYQDEFLAAQTAAARQALAAAELELDRPAARSEAERLRARLAAASAASTTSAAAAARGRAKAELRRAEDSLAAIENRLQRMRAEYQRLERDFLLSRNEARSRDLQIRLADLRGTIDALASDRSRAAAARDRASESLRLLNAETSAIEAALARLTEPHARARAALAAARGRTPAVQQLLVDPLGRVDRCPTCHIASLQPGFEAAREPLRTHVGRYLQDHPPERFSCTVCHGGQGRATRLPAAHGHVPQWREPLVDGNLMGGRCAVCHRGDTIPGEPYASAGRQLFVEAGCQGCHEVAGIAAVRIGPSLENIGSKVRAAWLNLWLRNPKAYLPRTRMPDFLLTGQDVADLSAFLLSLAPGTPSEVRSDASAHPDSVARGEEIYKESRCVTCHAVDGRGGTVGPDLGRVASKVNPAWLTAFLRDPAKMQPGTKMPRYRLRDADVRDLTAYLSSELRDFDEQAWPPMPETPGRSAEGRGLVRKYGCFGCHDIPGFGQTARVGAELTGYADKEVARLDFGLRRDVARSWQAWTDTKLREPRGFRDELKMPDYRLSSQERYALVTYLASLTEATPPPDYLREATPPAAYEPEGRFGELVADLKCLVCHTIRGRGGSVGPDLTREGSRVRPEWLRRFLDRPNAIRIFLAERMPRFRLTRDEIDVLAGYIETVLVDASVPRLVFAPGEITPLLVERGRDLFYQRYACDSCHQVGTQGGAIGPDLTLAGERLQEGWIYAWLRESRRLDPSAREPVSNLSEDDARAITAFLSTLRDAALYAPADGPSGR